jgi:surfactin synthase thioesterase subunit/aryl carrier-like protein
VTDHAARVLSRHAVPNVLWPVRTIARDANGKVRRRDAAAGLARALEAARRAPGRVRGETDALRHALVRMWEEILERAPIALDENFFAAGGDSLRSVRLLARIAASLGVALPANALLTAPTIDALADVILAAAARDQPSRLIALRAHGSRPPLFFFDGDVNGGGLYSRFLLETLHPEQPVYVIRPAGLADDDVPSIETMADGDAALIAHAVPSAVYRLAGYCNGGAIAFEAARRLEASGAAVDVVALIGSSAPNARLDALWRLTAANARRYRFARRIAHRLRGGSPIAQLPGIVRGIAGTARAAGYRSTPVFRTYEDRLLRYFPQPYDRTVDIIWADDDYLRLPGDATMGWGRVARVRRRSMRGDHTTMLTDHVAELGAALRAIVDEADALRDPPARPPDTGA